MKELFKEVKSEFYLNRYLKFVSHFQNKEIGVGIYVENHHILPRKIYPEYIKEKWNQVDLPYRAHYLAHYMLAKAIGGSMWAAFNSMNNKNRNKLSKLSSILYEVGKENAKIRHAEFLRFIDPETGLTNAQNSSRKAAETMKTTILENGLTIAQECARKAAETMKTTILENGLTIYENSSYKISKSRNTIQENGLTLAQNAGSKISETKKKNGSAKGARNQAALIIHIFNAEDKLMFISKGNFADVCKENSLPIKRLANSYKNMTKVKNGEFDGWYAIKIGKVTDFKD